MVRTFLRWFLRTFFVLLVLGVAIWWFENWRGANKLSQAKKDLKEAGFTTEIESFTRSEIPEEENLFLNPIFLAEWNGETRPVLTNFGRMHFSSLPKMKERRRTKKGELSAGPGAGRPLLFASHVGSGLSEEETQKLLHKDLIAIQDRVDSFASLILDNPRHRYDLWFPGRDQPEENGAGILRLTKLNGFFRDQAILSFREGDRQTAMRNIRVLDALNQSTQGNDLFGGLTYSVLASLIGTIAWDGIYHQQLSELELTEIKKIIMQSLAAHDRQSHLMTLMASSVNELSERYELSGHWEYFKPGQSSAFSFRDRTAAWVTEKGPSGWLKWRQAEQIQQFLPVLQGGSVEDVDWNEEISDWSPLYWVKSTNLPKDSQTLIGSARSKLAVHLIGISAELYYHQNGRYPTELSELDLDYDSLDLQPSDFSYELDSKGRPFVFRVSDAKGKVPNYGWRFN